MADAIPQSPISCEKDQRPPIELQCNNRRSPNCRQSKDTRAAIKPLEMFAPDLLPRVREIHDLAADRILILRTVSSVTIAQRAGQPKVSLFGQTTFGLGNEMLEIHRRPDNFFRG